MKTRSTLRRLGAVLVAPAIATGMLVAAPAAQAAPNSAPEEAASSWLAAQPGADGMFTSHYANFETGAPVAFTDYGLNLDLYAALAKVGATAKAEQVYGATIAHANDYTDSFGTRYAGAVGKLAATVQSHGGNAASVGTRNLIADIEGLLVTDGDEKGRAKDSPDGPYQSTNILNQGWVVRALAGANSDDVGAAVEFLLKQQCDDGSFRENVAGTQCTTTPGSVDGTAFSIQSLAIAADAGVTGIQDDIDEAANWLIGVQANDGSFTDAGSANANSTGLAGAALAAAARPTEAQRAARWVTERQVVLGPERGAIALNDSDLVAADVPVGVLDRDRYVRASVQAVLAMVVTEDQTPDATFAPTAADQYIQAGKTATVVATGLVPAEKFTAIFAGGGVVRGAADGLGKATVRFKAPTTAGSRAFTIVGSRLGRQGVSNLTALTARKLPTSVRSSSVKKKARQQVVAKGLRPFEPFQIRYRGKQIAKGKANSAGRVIRTFSVGGSKGRKSVNVYGLFTGRKGATSFKVK